MLCWHMRFENLLFPRFDACNVSDSCASAHNLFVSLLPFVFSDTLLDLFAGALQLVLFFFVHGLSSFDEFLDFVNFHCRCFPHFMCCHRFLLQWSIMLFGWFVRPLIEDTDKQTD